MFCKTSPQTSFFDVQKVLPNVLSKDDWCYLYRDQVYPFIDEEIFRELYPSETGRHGIVSIMDMAYGLIVFMGLIGMISSPLVITV